MKELPMKNYKNQNGTALIVSLLILIVTAMLGLSSVSSTNMEEKMSLNMHLKVATFQAAESAIKEVIDDNVAETLRAAMTAPVSGSVAINATVTATSEVDYQNSAITPGFTTKIGGGGFSFHNFIITGTGRIALDTTDSTNNNRSAAESEHILGVAQIGPGL